MNIPCAISHTTNYKDGSPMTTLLFTDVVQFHKDDELLFRYDPVTGMLWMDFKPADEQMRSYAP